ncbi:MAG: flagellar hook-associated protein FlgK [Defluviitaleaceae bacterium]|nr:flagellar hook-associated protein FlgK [Defluviitaleaceae bacterium]
MRSAFFGLHVATSGLNTARAQLNVTSHNIANSEIPGFSRQVAQMQAGRPLLGTGRGMYGTGSQVTGVIQIRDRFLDRKFWHQSAIHNQFTAKNTHLGFVETVFNQLPNVGVKRTFNGFFSTLQDLTTRAHEPTFRTNVVTNAHSLTEQIRQNAFALQRQQQDLNREFADVIVTINSLGQQIADINRQIHIFERDGSNANDLRDQRALLIDELSGLVNVQVEERDFSRPGLENDRRLSVMINGYDFVDHTRKNSLELVARDNIHDPRSGARRNEMDVGGLYDVFFTTTGSRFNIHSSTLSGKLRGIVDVRDGNGGQSTMPPTLTGSMMIADQLAALQRSFAFIDTLGTRLDTLSGSMPGWVTLRNDSLAALGGASTTQEAREYARALADQLSRRNELRSSINVPAPSHVLTLTTNMGLPSLRASIGNAVNLTANPALNAYITALEDLLENATTLANTAAAATGNSAAATAAADALSHDDFRDAIANLYAELGNHLPADHAVMSTLRNLQDNVNGHLSPLRAALTELASIPDDIEAQVTTANTHLTNLNTAMTGLGEITTFPERIHAQLEWAIGNAVDMLELVQRRIDEIESGAAAGFVADYEALRDELDAQIAAMRALANGLNLNTISPYASQADLEAFIAASATVTGLDAFRDSLEAILDEATAPGFPAGTSRPVAPTTNFKGIPFYMNQLNHLIRTFARAINEGRNADGLEIPGSTGHIFGFDANGDNRNTLFFTMEDPITGLPGMLVNDDPMQSLRLWILSDADGNPLRDANGNLVTVADPNPPNNVARDSMGRPLFTIDYSQFNALNFIVNPELMEDPSLLAASSNPNIGQANNDIVHGFLAVGNDQSLFREGRLIDFIIATSNHLAVDNNQAYMFRTSYAEVTHHTHNHRLSVKGVDTEEEMMNLVRFQNMFVASSRLINVLDTIYDTLINRLGNF